MVFKKIAKKLLALFHLQLLRINPNGLEKTLVSFHLSKADYTISDNKLFINKLNLEIDLLTHADIVEHIDKLLELQKLKNALLTNAEDQIYIHIDGITVNVQTGEEILILYEVFIKGIYNYNTADKFIAIDIGMNVAITSLYYSSFKNAVKIYSFEPFVPTFNQAVKNIGLNESGKKIIAENFGLGGRDHTSTVLFDPVYKGSMGVNSIPTYIPKSDNVSHEEITIKAASPVLRSIIEKESNYKKLLKIDCEGSEYDIIDDLANNNLLAEFDSIIIEWHIKGPDKLIETLINNNFNVFSFDPFNVNIGMLYASNKK